MELHVISIVLVIAAWQQGPTVHGLQCPSCTYVTTDHTNIASSLLKTVLDGFQDKECALDKITGPTPGIELEPCVSAKLPEVGLPGLPKVAEGPVARCSFFKATVTVKLSSLGHIGGLGTIGDTSLKIYQRGCYYGIAKNVPDNTCQQKNDFGEDLAPLYAITKSLSVAKMEGQLCLCENTYCQKSRASGPFRTYPMVLFGVPLLTATLLAL